MARLVLINNAHPSVGHVSGMRFGQFARSLSSFGHEVVLLTMALPDVVETAVTEIHETIPSKLARAAPLRLELVTPVTFGVLNVIRQNRVPSTLRRAITVWMFLRHGGPFPDWSIAAWPHICRLAVEFQPQLVWATFGNTSNLELARRLADLAECPWVIDVKDNWNAFIPSGLRSLMAHRFQSATAITANSHHHLSQVKDIYFRQPSKVIYSGVSPEFFASRDSRIHRKNQNRNSFVLVGSTYGHTHLKAFLLGLRDWLEAGNHELRSNFEFVYVGSDQARVAQELDEIALPCKILCLKQKGLSELCDLLGTAFATSYLWAEFGFHHKLLELLTIGLPVLAYPGEHDESHKIAASSSTPFYVCTNRTDLHSSLSKCWSERHQGFRKILAEDTAAWRWEDFAVELNSMFENLIQESIAGCAE